MCSRFSFLCPAALAAVVIIPGPGSETMASGAETGPRINQWEPEIAAFEAADKTNPPPQNAILFIGSSSIRMWPGLQQAFPGHKVFKRGFGGSELSDSVAFAGRIVLPYRPKMILMYAGDNDIANGKTPERILGDFKAFVQKVHAALPQCRIAYIAVKPCPARKQFLPKVKSTNRLIRDYTAADGTLEFIDICAPMLNPDGSLRPELFVQDGLHMNAKGYALWESIIRPELDKYDPPASESK
jgi:lysophospholipase L1-like esterase